MKLAIITIGCKVNQADSQNLLQHMLAAGYTPVEPGEQPDMVVLNSCAVTAESERKTRQKLRQLRGAHPDAVLVMTGCAAQVNANAGADYPEADLLLGHRDIRLLPQHIDTYFRCAKRIVSISPHQRGELFEDSSSQSSTCALTLRTRANVKIEDGCDRFCAYCIIPHARGRVRSKPLAQLRTELQSLATAGFSEVVLVGINLCAYGKDLGVSLCDAVELAAATPGIHRVRLGSLEPDLISEEMLQRLSRCEALCPHFHIALQSGCDTTLKDMRRNYTTEEYSRLAQYITKLFHSPAMTTDMMVGFPGESDDDFAQSLAFVNKIGFAKVHVFPFSPRKGTPAADMPQQLTKATKQDRAQQMLALAARLRKDFLAGQLGEKTEVLLEQTHPLGGMQGYTTNYTPVRIPEATLGMQNALLPIRIMALEEDGTRGELL